MKINPEILKYTKDIDGNNPDLLLEFIFLKITDEYSEIVSNVIRCMNYKMDFEFLTKAQINEYWTVDDINSYFNVLLKKYALNIDFTDDEKILYIKNIH